MHHATKLRSLCFVFCYLLIIISPFTKHVSLLDINDWNYLRTLSRIEIVPGEVDSFLFECEEVNH